jgi:hypothetical protein
MNSDGWIKYNLAVPLERSKCADLVCFHET